MDCLGASESPKDYVTAGTASTEMHGCAEALWQDDLVSFACLWIRFCTDNNFRDQKSYLNAYHKHFYLVVIVMQHLVGVLLWRWLKETKSRQENWRLVWIKMQYYGFPFGIHQIGHCWDTHVELFQINIYKFIPWFWIALCLLLVFVARFSCFHKIVRIMMVCVD